MLTKEKMKIKNFTMMFLALFFVSFKAFSFDIKDRAALNISKTCWAQGNALRLIAVYKNTYRSPQEAQKGIELSPDDGITAVWLKEEINHVYFDVAPGVSPTQIMTIYVQECVGQTPRYAPLQ